MAFIAIGLFFAGMTRTVHAAPPGPPCNVCEQLDAINEKVSLQGYPHAPVEKTGNAFSDTPGEDGDLQKGVAWPVPRFTDNEDGTVTDNLTGLIWLKNANCFGSRTWNQALSDCNNLANGSCGLTDGSIAGDWRLPHVKELQSLIDYGHNGPALSNTSGLGQWEEDDPFINVQLLLYWSSTTSVNTTDNAWLVYLVSGAVYCHHKDYALHVWCVRGGQ